MIGVPRAACRGGGKGSQPGVIRIPLADGGVAVKKVRAWESWVGQRGRRHPHRGSQGRGRAGQGSAPRQ